jgi:hypothetical protein
VEKTKIVYRDTWFRIIGSLVASQIIDAQGREESYFQRFTSKYFYIDLLGGFVIAFLLWEIARFSIRFLDRRYDWLQQPVQRILLQAILGVGMPALLSFFFTMAFMRIAYGQDIFQTSWLYTEYYAVILIIVLINIVYFAWWLFLHHKNRELALPLAATTEAAGILETPAVMEAYPANTTIEVTKAGKTILLPRQEIAYAYLNTGYCYIKTGNGTSQGETFVTTYTLDEVARLLGELHFFRVNRQILIARKSCSAYRSIENGKIELDIQPSFKAPVIVSQKRAKEFRKWIAEV